MGTKSKLIYFFSILFTFAGCTNVNPEVFFKNGDSVEASLSKNNPTSNVNAGSLQMAQSSSGAFKLRGRLTLGTSIIEKTSQSGTFKIHGTIKAEQ